MGGAVGGGFTEAVMGSVGGVPRIGNWTQFAEFNVLADPEAAAWLFGREGLAGKTTLVTLDLSHLVLAREHVQGLLLWGKDGKGGEEKGAGKSRLRTMLVELLLFFAKTYGYVCTTLLVGSWGRFANGMFKGRVWNHGGTSAA